MYVLSIDVGWKHLAYCILKEKEIIEWEIINLCEEDLNVNTLSIENLIENCKKGIEKFVFEKTTQLKNFSTNVKVFIESQPMGPFTKNIKTKILSHLLQYLFSIENIEIKFISSKKKLSALMNGKEKIPYQKLKKLAIEHCKELLLNTKWLEHFNNLKGKKDDLADCFLQGYYG